MSIVPIYRLKERIDGTNWPHLSKNYETLKNMKNYEKCITSDRSLFLNNNRTYANNLFGKSSLLEFLPA